MRIYFEQVAVVQSGHESKLLEGPLAASVPVAIINFRHELCYFPRTIVRSKYPNIKLWAFHEDGGHFGSMERPREYQRDIEKFLLLI